MSAPEQDTPVDVIARILREEEFEPSTTMVDLARKAYIEHDHKEALRLVGTFTMEAILRKSVARAVQDYLQLTEEEAAKSVGEVGS